MNTLPDMFTFSANSVQCFSGYVLAELLYLCSVTRYVNCAKEIHYSFTTTV